MLEAYLVTLPEPVMTRLFQSPASCLALLRLLSPLAKALVMRLLFTKAATPMENIENFVKDRKQRVEALQKLRALKMVRERFTSNSIEINGTFQRSLQVAITCGAANESFEETGDVASMTELRQFQQQRWEAMLHFMVASAPSDMSDPSLAVVPAQFSQRKGLSATIVSLLVHSGLLTRQKSITSSGFQFLLQDQRSQIWALLIHYLNNANELDMDPVDILGFLFRLGTLELGRGHSAKHLSEQHQRILDELAELGIVMFRDRVFYAAIELSNVSEPVVKTSASASSKGFIIVETNYRLYAYTDSPLQISILNLFCSLKARFANLVIARLTRQSARRALSNGITADQIIQYLTVNQRGGGVSIPPTITDQIKLWQLELDRFKQAPGFLFRDFALVKQYNQAMQFAQDVGALLWKNDKTRMFFVDEKSGRDVTEFVNKKMRED